MKDHLIPAGKPAPPRPRKPEFLTTSITSAGFFFVTASLNAAKPPSFSYTLSWLISGICRWRKRMYDIGFLFCDGDDLDLTAGNFNDHTRIIFMILSFSDRNGLNSTISLCGNTPKFTRLLISTFLIIQWRDYQQINIAPFMLFTFGIRAKQNPIPNGYAFL